MDNGFTGRFEREVKETIRKYRLVDRENKVIVAYSGGKDSATVLYLMKKFGYDAEGLMIDLMMDKWSVKNLKKAKQFCRQQDIKLHVVGLGDLAGSSVCRVRSEIQSRERVGSCTICGVMKRWILNKKSRELGGNKIATGHNLDDEAETVLMNLMTGNPNMGRGLGPSTGVSDAGFVERIKPLYFHTNKEVRKYSEIKGFPVLYESCPSLIGSFRHEIRRHISVLEKECPGLKKNVVNNFLEISKVLRKENGKRGIMHCAICGEPSRGIICKRCRLMNIVK